MIEKKYIEMEGVFSGSRVINIYLPDDYNERRKKYPVLYMFDGHNLYFDEEAAFGKSWGMKEYLDSNNAVSYTHLDVYKRQIIYYDKNIYLLPIS